MSGRMTTVHARRLLKLADKLESVERKAFDMGVWAVVNEDAECGTAACALGHAGMMTCFRRLGLKTEVANIAVNGIANGKGTVEFWPVTEKDKEHCRLANREDSQMGYSYTKTSRNTHLNAGRRFFGLSRVEADALFLPHDGHRTPKQVAKFIRKLVKRYHPEVTEAA